MTAPINSPFTGWLPHIALLSNAPIAGPLPGFFRPGFPGLVFLARFSRNATLPFLQTYGQPQFLPEITAILSDVVCKTHSAETSNPCLHPQTGSTLRRHASILLWRIFDRRNTSASADISPIHADDLSGSPRNEGVQIRAATRAGLLLGEMALVNWSSCQLVLLQC